MASMSSGMANGTTKPGYMGSFMDFIGTKDPQEKSVASSKSETNKSSKNKINSSQLKNNVSGDAGETEVSSSGADINPPDDEVPPTDHTPSDSYQDERPFIADENTNSSEATYNGENDGSSRRNVARRGRRRSDASGGRTSPDNSGNETTDSGKPAPRETPRRAARAARAITNYGAFDIDDSDEFNVDDPDYNMTDSDDDPDFNPKRNTTQSDEEIAMTKPRRGRGRGRSFGRGRGGGMSKGVKRSIDLGSNDESEKPSSTDNNTAAKRRGRPPSYTSQSSPTGGDDTVTSTDDKPKLSSSSFNFSRSQRPNTAIRIPEAPQLTPEQLELVESQFKSGDFVMAKKDIDMLENPPIWRIDGKSLLQKFQAFEKDGKTLYRNISTYSGWTSQAKALYVGVKVTFVFQSRYDTVVEMVGLKSQTETEETNDTKSTDDVVWLPKNQQQDFEISEELRSHMPDFEIYLQSLISQALDNNFLKEIYEENDDYFVERVKVIDELAEQRKKKIVGIVVWDDKFRKSLDTWPCINVMITKNADKCQACNKNPATKLSQLYGQPYDQETLRSREPLPSEVDTKNYEVCERCSTISQMYNKVSHQKYDYYSQCKSTVTNMRVTHPSKHTTTILRDLLANDHWIMGLFRSMCTTWIKVDRMHQEEGGSPQKNDENNTDSKPTSETNTTSTEETT